MKNSKKVNFPIEKIHNPKLLKLATEESGESATVLIELNLPVPRVDFARTKNRGMITYSPKRIESETTAQREKTTQKIDAATAFLEDVLGETPRWLKSARAFVANVNSEQLREIARSPLTKAIHPNRRLELNRSKHKAPD
ncbi:MAG: hypothetical protein ONB44_07625 [candidate division KSB1 bacterium]|nr:hypothetical protein [candidate division KSB1 bacterium]MDZ7301996.1 hypothetical protein [candidate division KSB1 bacterium]MDZ7310178.1 hypothetical protein [candidate division KSB1 bacterium]